MKARIIYWLLGVILIGAGVGGFIVLRQFSCPMHPTAEIFVQTTLQAPLANFKLHVGRFPTTEEGLQALLTCPPGTEGTWKGPYLNSIRVPVDPWGNPYEYRCPATRSSRPYDVWSMGPDRVPSADDIGNWQVSY